MQCLEQCLEVGSSVFSFVGGAILAVDAFSARKTAKLKKSARELEERIDDLFKRKSSEEVTAQLEDSLAERTRQLTIIGFAILTLGFLLDLIVKLHLVE